MSSTIRSAIASTLAVIAAAHQASCRMSRTMVGEPILLALGGRTDYRIVTPEHPSGPDEYALRKLAEYLRQSTGAEFPIHAPESMVQEGPAIFVGLSGPALTHLGAAPLASLSEQEHVTRTIGQNIFLYGNGVHGNLHAVFEFLENSLGWRWYTVYCNPVVPSRPTLARTPLRARRRQPLRGVCLAQVRRPVLWRRS